VTFILSIVKALLALLLPELLREIRKPREVLFLGGDAGLRDDVADSVTRELGERE
jgi:hypothetical protein